MMKRRSFIRGLMALSIPPLALRSPSRAVQAAPIPTIPVLWGDGIHDDAPAIQAFANRERVIYPSGAEVGQVIRGGEYLLGSTVIFPPGFYQEPRQIYDAHFNTKTAPAFLFTTNC